MYIKDISSSGGINYQRRWSALSGDILNYLILDWFTLVVRYNFIIRSIFIDQYCILKVNILTRIHSQSKNIKIDTSFEKIRGVGGNGGWVK